MNSQLLHYLRGYVRLVVTGPSFERLINRLVESGIPVWDIRRSGEHRGEFFISLPDFFRLKRYLRETGCRMRVAARFGAPFFLDKLGRRKWFLAGAASFVLGMYLLSAVVWSVQVTGNDTIPEDQILEAAVKEGIYPLQWKFRMKEPNDLADQLVRALPNVSWIGVDIQGTKVTIRVVEATVPEKKAPQSPRHLVSSADAVITSIIADRGVPQVGVNSRVKRGDILISGILGDEENREVVVAEGSVRGLVWYEYRVEAPIVQQHQALTGNAHKKFHLVLGNRALQLTGYWQDKYEHEQREAERKQLRVGSWTAPVGWMTVTHREATVIEDKRDAEEAKAAGIASARNDLLASLGRNAVIHGEKILQERTDNGKVILTVLLEAEIDLAVERPILEQELQPPETGKPRS